MATPSDEEKLNETPPKKKGRGETASTIGRMVAYSHIAYVFIGAFGLPSAAGIWIDSQAATTPWGTILGVTLGLILSTIVAYREVRSTGSKLSGPTKSHPPGEDEGRKDES